VTSAPEGLVRPEVSSTAMLPFLPSAAARAALRPSDSGASVPWCLPPTPTAAPGSPAREGEEGQQGGR